MLRDLIALPDDSKVWIYQADREITYDELDEIRPLLYNFSEEWASHGLPVQSYANVFHRRFIVFVADESQHSVSGCSIDNSVNLVKYIEKAFNIDMFNRTLYTYMIDEEIDTLPHQEMKQAYSQGKIDDQTFFFDNLVSTKLTFLRSWVKPLKESWHYKFIGVK